MGKYIFYTLMLSIIGVISAPNFLMADNLSVKSPGADAVLTVEPEPEPEPVVNYAAQATYTTHAVEPAYVAPAIMNYTVTRPIYTISEYENTAYSLSYTDIYKFNKMIYGHNSWNLLGSLSGRYAGEVITITEGGVARQYRVAMVQTYQKTADGFLNGDKRLMGNIANTALGYDVALFTCAGTSYGNGDASHRLVVFANAI